MLPSTDLETHSGLVALPLQALVPQSTSCLAELEAHWFEYACSGLPAGWETLSPASQHPALQVWVSAHVGAYTSVGVWSEVPLLQPLPSPHLHQTWDEKVGRWDLSPEAMLLQHDLQHCKAVCPD